MVDPDNEERLLKVPPHVVKRIKAEAYAEAVAAVKALPWHRPWGSSDPWKYLHRDDALAAIEGLGVQR